MNRDSVFLSLLVFVAGCSIHQPNSSLDGCRHTETTFQCVQFLNNYDGDTITVNILNVPPILGQKITVRVAHIDAPEMKGHKPCEKEKAQAAKKFVFERLSKAGEIELKNIQRDKYFRILADVFYDGKNLSDGLLNSRLAVPYEGGTKVQASWCQ